MIILFTDFSHNGPYVGQLKSAIYKINPAVNIIDLMHDAPGFDIKHSALLLSTLIEHFPDDSIFCCVIDPGVGSSRNAVVLKIAQQYFIGPDNGLFEYILRTDKCIKSYKIVYQANKISTTFHGRDIFAPVAAQLSNNNIDNLEEINNASLTRFNWQADLSEIIYIDSFGNLMTGIRAASLNKQSVIHYKGYQIGYARTYSEMTGEQCFWYPNSNNLVEIAVNSQSAARQLNSQIGDFVQIS